MPSETSVTRELLRMGVRNVGRNRRRSLISAVMIAVAVAGVVFFQGYTLGIRRMLVSAAVESSVGAFQVQREGYSSSQDLAPLDLDLPEDTGIADRLRGLPNVKEVAPRLLFTGQISNGDTSTMLLGLGIDPARERGVCPQGPAGQQRSSQEGSFGALEEGAPLTDHDQAGVILSKDLAEGLNLKVGDTVVLLARTRGGSMDSVDLTVQGIFRFDDPMANKQFAVVPLGVAQRLLHMPARATAFAVAVHDLAALEATLAAVRTALEGLTPRAAVLDWVELAPYAHDVNQLQDGIFSIVLIVVALIVLAGIANTMMMSAFERKREIGTLMAIGFRRQAILGLFVIESIWLAVLAAAGGAVIGAAIVLFAARTGIGFSIPGGHTVMTRPELRIEDVLLTLVGATLGALLAGLLPAARASRLHPVEALRSD